MSQPLSEYDIIFAGAFCLQAVRQLALSQGA
ncbi:hypothetical protein AZE42_13327 [Rhizopogon vesiculosus]|uniref:Uncharacterized protein n=1 Tax=Rhizopogon vesiculosus TaxID=180088 RepID=A0A1J8QGU1_9AGAM|nr:hypothetical protein AZE42_13327 [Rhizopogon vesiculosus]